jgi:hypothetical protein
MSGQRRTERLPQAHAPQVWDAYERVLAGASARSRQVEVGTRSMTGDSRLVSNMSGDTPRRFVTEK